MQRMQRGFSDAHTHTNTIDSNWRRSSCVVSLLYLCIPCLFKISCVLCARFTIQMRRKQANIGRFTQTSQIEKWERYQIFNSTKLKRKKRKKKRTEKQSKTNEYTEEMALYMYGLGSAEKIKNFTKYMYARITMGSNKRVFRCCHLRRLHHHKRHRRSAITVNVLCNFLSHIMTIRYKHIKKWETQREGRRRAVLADYKMTFLFKISQNQWIFLNYFLHFSFTECSTRSLKSKRSENLESRYGLQMKKINFIKKNMENKKNTAMDANIRWTCSLSKQNLLLTINNVKDVAKTERIKNNCAQNNARTLTDTFIYFISFYVLFFLLLFVSPANFIVHFMLDIYFGARKTEKGLSVFPLSVCVCPNKQTKWTNERTNEQRMRKQWVSHSNQCKIYTPRDRYTILIVHYISMEKCTHAYAYKWIPYGDLIINYLVYFWAVSARANETKWGKKTGVGSVRLLSPHASEYDEEYKDFNWAEDWIGKMIEWDSVAHTRI